MNGTIAEETKPRFQEIEKILIFGSLIIISLLTVCGNVLVFWAYFKNPKLRIANNYFILSLATADLIIGGLSINFYAVYMVFGYWPLGKYICDFYLSVDYWCCQTSVFNLVAICIDRFCSLKYPVQYRNKRSPRMVLGVIVGIWVLSFLIWVPMIISYQFISGERTVSDDACYIQFLYESWYITIITAMFAYYGPVILMAALYAHIYFALLTRKRKVSRQINRSLEISREFQSNISHNTSVFHSTIHADTRSNTSLAIHSDGKSTTSVAVIGGQEENTNQVNVQNVKAQKRALKDHDKALFMIILIFLVFTITWLPYDIFAVVAPFCPDCISMDWWDFGYLLCYINSTINPFCYAMGNKRFKNTFKKIICLKNRGKKYRKRSPKK